MTWTEMKPPKPPLRLTFPDLVSCWGQEFVEQCAQIAVDKCGRFIHEIPVDLILAIGVGKALQCQLEEVKMERHALWKQFIELRKECGLLESERDKLLQHFDVCKSDQIVTLVIERELLRERVTKLRAAGYVHDIICLVCSSTTKHTRSCWWGLALEKDCYLASPDDLLQKNGESDEGA